MFVYFSPSNFVPISLLVTLEMVKFFQGSFMDWDMEMYDEDQHFAMRAQSTAINEELGQVQIIFSDKTGTLTCNIMEFKKFSSVSMAYDTTKMEEGDNMINTNQPMDFNENPDGLVYKNEKELDAILNDTYNSEHAALNEVLMHLAVCHTVVVDKNKGLYNAASPDELALVDGAKSLGYVFVGREPDNILLVRDKAGYEKRFKLLNVLEFNSTRKRMSVIVQNMQTGYIELYCKGADNIIAERLVKGYPQHDKQIERTMAYVEQFSKEGLRTLLLAKKDLS